MMWNTILGVIISFLIIILVHYLFIFFKDTLTVPKVKDLVHEPLQRYKNIEKLNQSSSNKENNENNENKDITKIEDIPNITDEKETMKMELKNFFNEIKDNTQITNISNFDQSKLYSEIR